MSVEGNKAAMRRFYEEFWCKGNRDAVDALVAPDIIDHQRPEGWPAGAAGMKRLLEEWRPGFPDMNESVDDLIAEGDKVVGRFTIRATHTGPFLGIPPTGRKVEVRGIDIVRFREGRVVEWWYCEDALGLFQQLDRFPPGEAIPGVGRGIS